MPKAKKKTITKREMKSFVSTDIYLFKINNRNNRTMCEICSEVTIKTTE